MPWARLSGLGMLDPAAVAPRRMRFMAFTAASACPLICGRCGDDVSSVTPHSAKNCLVEVATSCGPLSEYMTVGTSLAKKKLR